MTRTHWIIIGAVSAGLVLLGVFTCGGLIVLGVLSGPPPAKAPDTTQYFTRDEFKKLVMDCEFEVVEERLGRPDEYHKHLLKPETDFDYVYRRRTKHNGSIDRKATIVFNDHRAVRIEFD